MAVIWRSVATIVLVAYTFTCGIPSHAGTRARINRKAAFVGGSLNWIQNARLAALLQGPVSGPVSYVYDELGRLVAAIDAAGSAAVYSYDAVGNILSIHRYASTDLSLITFSPKQGPAGTTVTIAGTGFSSVIGNNSVQFNGTTASLVSSTPNQIVATVPVAATTGLITITTPLGTITSTDPFTVTSAAGVPQITSFTPQVAAPATSINLVGTNFDPTPANDRLKVNITAAAVPSSVTSTSLTMTVPAATGSGHIILSAPAGLASSTGDLFIPPSPFTVAQVGYTGRTTPGTATTVSIPTANKIGLLLFEGVAGQRVSATSSSSTFQSSCNYKIYKPDNTALGSSTSCTSYLDPQVLPVSGTYTILVDASSSASGSVALTVYQYSGDVTANITAGGPPVTVQTMYPGQNAILTFPGTVNQHTSISVVSSTFTSCNMYVYKPNVNLLPNVIGPQFSNTGGCQNGASFTDLPALPVAGTYFIVVDPFATAIGTIVLKLNDATDVTGTIATDGTPVTIATTVPGQNARLSFSGTTGQRVSVLLDNNAYSSGASMQILSPSGTTVASVTSSSSPSFIDDVVYCSSGLYICNSITLPATGTYTLFVDPTSAGTGSARLRAFNVPADASVSSSLGGAQISVSMPTPGQNGRVTFAGTQGGRASVAFNTAAFSGVMSPWYSFQILNPDGTPLGGTGGGSFSFNASTTSGFVDYNDLYPFPVTGTYTLVVDPYVDTTGSLNLRLYDATDASPNVNADGTANAVSTTSPGQNIHLNIPVTVGQRISALVTNINYPSGKPNAIFRRVAGSSTFNVAFPGSDGTSIYMEPVTISDTGSYFLFLDPIGQDIGSLTAALYTVTDATGTISTNGTPVTISTPTPGQNARYTFSGTSGQSLTLSLTGGTYAAGRCTMTIKRPDNSQLASVDCSGSSHNYGPYSLTSTGTYTIVVDPTQSQTGSVTISATAN